MVVHAVVFPTSNSHVSLLEHGRSVSPKTWNLKKESIKSMLNITASSRDTVF